MSVVKVTPLPEIALLNEYAAESTDNEQRAYTDCYSLEIGRQVSLAEFVFAFYTAPVFKLERLILKFAASLPSTDAQAQQIADGSIQTFAAWSEEHRTEDQLLMCDFRGRTRSWFMVTSQSAHSGEVTSLLQFGSAVVPQQNRRTGKLEMAAIFRLLLGFHKLYSRILLRSAKCRLERLAAGR